MLKRLRYYLDRVTDNKTTTYRYNDIVDGRPVQKELYDGECVVVYVKPNGERDGDRTGTRREPTFWHNDVAYTIDRTTKLALDRPTITTCIPVTKLNITHITPAAADYCLREIRPYFEAINAQYANKSRPDRDNGKFYLYDAGSKVMARNAAYFAMIPAKDYKDGKGATIYECRYEDLPADIMCLCIRMEIQLPYLKLDRAKTMLLKQLPETTESFIKEFDTKGMEAALKLEQTQQDIRTFLRQNGYCSFIANGSILARERGSDKPAPDAIPFQSPKEHQIVASGVKGMGIKQGVVVITGGGYSGKSTVLNAISAGIYNHTSGDGRELCITDDTAATITAEDGRAISSVNISPFIKWIPGSDPTNFTSAHASGSTSQGANIMEAVALGAKLLLIDEDRSATNFMIRDATMKKLIQKEPITPFTDRVQELSSMGVSTILVIGGSGEYLAVADQVFMMDEFLICDVTAQAKGLANENEATTQKALADKIEPTNPKSVKCESDYIPPACWDNNRAMMGCFSAYPKGTSREKLMVSDTGFIIVGDEHIDIRCLHDIATEAQINALAFMLRHLAKSGESEDSLEAMAMAMRGLSPKEKPGSEMVSTDITAKAHELFMQIEANGLDLVDTSFFTGMSRFMDMPRPYELLATINRMKGVVWQKIKKH